MENCPSNRNPVVAPLSVLMYALGRKTTPLQSQDKPHPAPVRPTSIPCHTIIGETRADEKAGLRRDAIGSQVIDVLKAQEINETGNEESQHRSGEADREYFG